MSNECLKKCEEANEIRRSKGLYIMLHSFILILSPSQLKEGTKRYKNGKIVQQSNTLSLQDYSSNFCSSLFFSPKKHILAFFFYTKYYFSIFWPTQAPTRLLLSNFAESFFFTFIRQTTKLDSI